jgi:hypothetical protein
MARTATATVDQQVCNTPPHRSEEPERLRVLRTAIGGGDWELARAAAEEIAAERLPASAEGLKARAETLTELLNAARAGRAHLVDSFSRVNAARRFQGSAGI